MDSPSASAQSSRMFSAAMNDLNSCRIWRLDGIAIFLPKRTSGFICFNLSELRGACMRGADCHGVFTRFALSDSMTPGNAGARPHLPERMHIIGSFERER